LNGLQIRSSSLGCRTFIGCTFSFLRTVLCATQVSENPQDFAAACVPSKEPTPTSSDLTITCTRGGRRFGLTMLLILHASPLLLGERLTSRFLPFDSIVTDQTFPLRVLITKGQQVENSLRNKSVKPLKFLADLWCMCFIRSRFCV